MLAVAGAGDPSPGLRPPSPRSAGRGEDAAAAPCRVASSRSSSAAIVPGSAPRGFSQLTMKLRSRGSALCRKSGQTSFARPSRTSATAARAWRSASRSFASSLTTGRCQTEAVNGRPVGEVRATDSETMR